MKASPQTNNGLGGFFNRSQPPASAPARAMREEEKVELLDDDEEAPSQQVSAAHQEEGEGSIAKKGSKERVELVEDPGAPRTDSQVALQYGEMDEDIKNVIRARDDLPGMRPPVDDAVPDREGKALKNDPERNGGGNVIPASSDAAPAAAPSPRGGGHASPARPADRAGLQPPTATTTPPRAPTVAHSRPSHDQTRPDRDVVVRPPPASMSPRPNAGPNADEEAALPLLEATLVPDDYSVYLATYVPDVVEQVDELSDDGSYDLEPLPLWKRHKSSILVGVILLLFGLLSAAIAMLVMLIGDGGPTPPPTTPLTSLPTSPNTTAPDYALFLSLEGPSNHSISHYGTSVAISGDGNFVAVGATEGTDETTGEATGAVYFYSLEGKENADGSKVPKSPPSMQVIYGASPGGEFGNAVALSRDGRRMVVGARSEKKQAGIMRVYQRDKGVGAIGSSTDFTSVAGGDYDATPPTWSLMEVEGGVFSGNPSEHAAWSVSISGDGNMVAMGLPKGGSHLGGSVLAFKYDDLSMRWKSYGSMLQGLLMGEEAGFSISLSYTGSIMAVGFPKAENLDGSSNAGKTAVYFMNGPDWQLMGQELYGKAEGDDGGTSVAMSHNGRIVVIGSKGRNEVDASTGDVILESRGNCHVYQIQTSRWELQHSIVGKARGERLGSSVAVSLDGNTVACGGVGGVNDDLKRSGVVRLWNRMTLKNSTIWPQGDSADVENAAFGASIAISADGEYVVVGAPAWGNLNVGGVSTGAIQIFRTDLVSTKSPSLRPSPVPTESLFPSSSGVPSSIPSSCLPKSATLEKKHPLNNTCEGSCYMYTALSGNTAVITEGNFVHFFEFMDGTWREVNVASFGPSTSNKHTLLPYISGDVVAVGAIYHTPINFVIIFERSDSEPFWLETHRIMDPNDNKSPFNEFGSAVAIDGPWLVVGCRNDQGARYAGGYFDDNKGSVYIYHRDTLKRKYHQTQKLAPDYTDDTNGWFGSAVAIREGTMVVGARRYKPNRTGAVFVYSYDEETGNWNESQHRIFNEDCVREFGISVALGVDEELFVGCSSGGYYDKTFTGRAYHYVRLDGNDRAYVQTQKFVPSNVIAGNDFFGANIAVDGNVMAIAAYGQSIVIGRVYVFARSTPNDEWAEAFQITNPDKTSVFGGQVQLSGSTMLTIGNDATVYMYTIEC